MSIDRDFRTRVRAYNDCLLQTDKVWTKKLLIAHVNKRLQEAGFKAVSDRTFEGDKQTLREKGWEGRLIDLVYDKRTHGYSYASEDMALPNVYVSDGEKEALLDLMPLVNELGAFCVIEEVELLMRKLREVEQEGLGGGGKRLEFDHSQFTPGGEQFMGFVYRAIREQRSLDVLYKPLSRGLEEKVGWSPYRLKQSRHRWYVLGWHGGKADVLGLERIEHVTESLAPFVANTGFDMDRYFGELVGVAKPYDMKEAAVRVVLLFRGSSVPFVRTKQIHSTARLVEDLGDSLVVELCVKLNYELETLILGFGEHVVVREPEVLRGRIRERLHNATQQYN